MKPARTIALITALCVPALAMPLGGCEEKPAAKPTPAPAPANTGKPTGTPDKTADKHDHDHGAAVAMGEQSNGGFTVKASRDGEIKAGSEASFDISVTGAAKVATVRLWVGTQDAKGSTKAKAETEGPGWHAHVDVPNPIPAEGRLWVEVESDKGEKALVSFEIKH